VAVWITIFWVFIIIVNVFGTLGYAEEEFVSSCFKLAATVIFMIVAIILICGGGPSDGLYSEYWGARLWVSLALLWRTASPHHRGRGLLLYRELTDRW
jgi:yeast amino acid transporter